LRFEGQTDYHELLSEGTHDQELSTVTDPHVLCLT